MRFKRVSILGKNDQKGAWRDFGGKKNIYIIGGGTENPQKGVFLRSLMGVKKKEKYIIGGGTETPQKGV